CWTDCRAPRPAGYVQSSCVALCAPSGDPAVEAAAESELVGAIRLHPQAAGRQGSESAAAAPPERQLPRAETWRDGQAGTHAGPGNGPTESRRISIRASTLSRARYPSTLSTEVGDGPRGLGRFWMEPPRG